MDGHKIGEQEKMILVDGKQHMIKYVDNDGHWKDLGILNEDGLLPCPFCGEYPTIKEELDEHDERIYAVEHECNIYMTTGWNHDRQTVIDAGNRRA